MLDLICNFSARVCIVGVGGCIMGVCVCSVCVGGGRRGRGRAE